ncbi:extracellular solute-binding protein [Streptomyces sp. NPDC090127]|uniref:extracellular solute-binding protein n=1 Tax=Streptomyces sp. NPDC090127 TaxID=3365953 RepID=UPI00382159C0
MSTGVSRRSVLQTIGIGTALAATGVSLSACSTPGGSGQDAGNSGKDLAPFPTYVPFAGPEPDLAATEQGVQAGYLTYPSELTQSVQEKPGDGKKIRAWFLSWGATPVPREKNRFWLAVEAALGVELELTVVPAMEYETKLATLMASGEMPDILQVVAAPNEAQFVLNKCADLTEHLSGDAVKKYPNLANVPTYAWKATGRFNGRLYGVPVERPLIGHGLIANQEKFKEAGIWVPEAGGIDADAFTKGLKQLSVRGKYGLGASQIGAFGFNSSIANHGSPNIWSVKDGAFVNYIETDEFKAGLEQMVRWQKDGVFRRDALSVDGGAYSLEFYNGTTYSQSNAFGGYKGAVLAVKDGFTVDMARPFKPANGASPKHWLGSGIYGYTVLKKAPKERIELLLRVMDYLAAPFGTTEYELVNHGVEGTHFTRGKDGGPVVTKLAAEGGDGPANLPLTFIAGPPQALYLPDQPEATKRYHAYQQEMIPIGVPSAHYGLRSNAWANSERGLVKQREDAINAVVTGKRSLSDWDAVVKEFKAKGGAKAAESLAKEYAAAAGN